MLLSYTLCLLHKVTAAKLLVSIGVSYLLVKFAAGINEEYYF